MERMLGQPLLQSDTPLNAPDAAFLAPLAVDLDDTLVRADLLHEAIIRGLRDAPMDILKAAASAAGGGGIASFKAAMVDHGPTSFASLPYRSEFITFLQREKAKGRKLILVSASPDAWVQGVAAHLGIFDAAFGSTATLNLKGAVKAAFLAARYPDGFAYAGDSKADLKVWEQACEIILVAASGEVARRAGALAAPIAQRFERPKLGLMAFAKAARVHQWIKNLLVFVPVVLVQSRDPDMWLAALLAFVAMSLVASSTYFINDLLDLDADRAHATKATRAFASGAIGALPGALLALAGLTAGFAIAAATNVGLVLGITAYTVLTLAYSFGLKRVALLDALTIGVLFTLRLVIGCYATGMEPTPWILSFAVTLFFSLALAKRQTEIVKKAKLQSKGQIAGRGYLIEDSVLTIVHGVASNFVAIVILMLFITFEANSRGIYRDPEWLWAIPFIMQIWSMRIWHLAHHGLLKDDPIVFSLKDKVSLGLGGLVAIAFLMSW